MNTKRIKELNDNFRQTFNGGRLILTQGVRMLNGDVAELLSLVQTFDNFTEDNDPYGEHDFGAITFKAQTYFWKIDYYDADYLGLSPDASDPNVTNRVLTVMLAEEY